MGNHFFSEMRRKLPIFNFSRKIRTMTLCIFLVKNKIPTLHSGMGNAARFLSQSLGFNSFLIRIRYTKL